MLPFACLTNGGGTLENDRAHYLNKIVFGQEILPENPSLTGE